MKEDKIGKIISIVGIGLSIIGLIIFSWYLYCRFSLSNSDESTASNGQVGDYIGGVIGSIWSLAAVFLYYSAIILQKKQIEQQQIEIKLQTEALTQQNTSIQLQIEEQKQANKIYTEQQYVLELQQFENTFFSLLKTQQDILESIVIEGKTKREAFDLLKYYLEKINDDIMNTNIEHIENITKNFQLQKNINNQYSYLLKEKHGSEIKNGITILKKFLDTKNMVTIKEQTIYTYRILYNKYQHNFSHYFRNLYHILKFLKMTEELELSYSKTKDSDNIHASYKIYSDILQANMSTSELLILFYNGLCFPKMKELIHHYNFLENLNPRILINPNHLYLYSKETDSDGKIYKEVTFKDDPNYILWEY
jgi:hypothetical protein